MGIFNIFGVPAGVTIFTVVEVVILAIWLNLALAHREALSIIVLAVGLFVEHAIAYRTGKL